MDKDPDFISVFISMFQDQSFVKAFCALLTLISNHTFPTFLNLKNLQTKFQRFTSASNASLLIQSFQAGLFSN